MGDGAGIMLQIPTSFFAKRSRSMGLFSPQRENTALVWYFCLKSRVRDWLVKEL